MTLVKDAWRIFYACFVCFIHDSPSDRRNKKSFAFTVKVKIKFKGCGQMYYEKMRLMDFCRVKRLKPLSFVYDVIWSRSQV